MYRISAVIGNFNHRYNVSPIHLHVLLGVWSCTKVVHVCSESHEVVRDCRKFEKH
jgi:hypothetical protein